MQLFACEASITHKSTERNTLLRYLVNVVVCKIYLDRGSYRSAAGEFTYKCIPTVKKADKERKKKK